MKVHTQQTLSPINEISSEHIEILNESIESEYCKDINKFKVEILIKIEQLNKLITSLNSRLNNVEKTIDLKEIAGKLSKHYEQNRRHK